MKKEMNIYILYVIDVHRQTCVSKNYTHCTPKIGKYMITLSFISSYNVYLTELINLITINIVIIIVIIITIV